LNPDESIALVKSALTMATFGNTYGASGGNITNIVVSSENTASKKANQQMLVNQMRTLGISTAAMIAIRAYYDEYNEAMWVLNLVSNAMDNFIEHLGDEAGDSTLANQGIAYSNDNTYAAMKALKPIFVTAMKALGATLSRSKEYEVPLDTMSIILLAYNEYGDINRAAEIKRRNKTVIFHPGFIPGGETISILAA